MSEHQNATPLVHSIAGVFGSLISQTVTYPLLCISSKLQAKLKNQHSKDNNDLNLNKSENHSDNDPIDYNLYRIFLSIIKNEGISELYAGYNSAMIGALYSSGVYYYFYELINKKLIEFSGRKRLSLVSNIIAASFAGSLTAIFSNPIWLINTRHSVEKKKENRLGIIKTLTKIISEDGFFSLWSGVIPSLILVINPIIQYVTFERIKIIIEKYTKKPLNGFYIFILGALTKLLASFLTYPYLLVRTRLQVNNQRNNQKYKNTFDCIVKIFNDEGISGFYSGLSLKLLHSVITTALLFLIKEESLHYVVKLFILLGLSKKNKMSSI